LIGVFLALVVLTIVTVAATYLPSGPWEIWISMGIATIKATLVAAYFMHLRYDNPRSALLLGAGLLFMALFVAFILMDVTRYQGDLIDMNTLTP
jgi:cytochrome c oxidase subunit 4